MANNNDTRSCATTSWISAVLAGILLAALLMLIGDWTFIQAAFAGVIAAIILGFILTFFMCPDGSAKSDLEAVRNGSKGAAATSAGAAAAVAATAASAKAAASSAGSAGAGVAADAASAAGSAASGAADAASAAGSSASGAVSGAADATQGAGSAAASGAAASGSAAAALAAGDAATASKPFEIKPSTPLAGEADLAARKGDWKYEAEAPKAKKAPAKKAAAKKAPAKAAPAKKAAAKKAPAKTAAAKSDTAAAKPKRAPVAADGKPETLKKARSGGADDLKLISGVGPKMEGMLNKLGFYHFDQVAGWRKKEVAWVNDNLEGFKGRVERDDWVAQAKILAKGGQTEFSKRKSK